MIRLEDINKESFCEVCNDGINYYCTKDSELAAWNDCKRPDWLIWAAVRMKVDKKEILNVVCDCLTELKPFFRERKTDGAKLYVNYWKVVQDTFLYTDGKLLPKDLSETYNTFLENDCKNLHINPFADIVKELIDRNLEVVIYLAVELFQIKSYKKYFISEENEVKKSKFNRGQLVVFYTVFAESNNAFSKLNDKGAIIFRNSKRDIETRFCEIIKKGLTAPIENKINEFKEK